MIIQRYLLRQITKPLAAILAILIALFASYSAASFLADAANGLLPAGAIIALTGLKVLIALEVLIPAALYVSVILSFTRLGDDNELTAMAALRMPPAARITAVLVLSAALAIAVGGLSLFVRPWAYQRLHALSGRAGALLDVDEMVPGTFYVGQNGTRVILLAHRDGPGSPARNVFIKLRHSDRTEIISAQLAYALPQAGAHAVANVYLRNAHIYEIDRSNGQADDVVEAQGVVVDPNSSAEEPIGYSSVSAASHTIAQSGASEDVAEFQWRLSTPLSTLLLGLLAIPLSRSNGDRRAGRYPRLVAAMLVYFGYYLLSTSARTWVQHGVIGAFPGIWWVPALLAIVLFTAAFPPQLDAVFGRGAFGGGRA